MPCVVVAATHQRQLASKDAKRWLPVGEAGEAMAQQQQASPGARILPGTLSMHPTVGGASPGPNQVLMTVQQQQGTPQDPHCKRDLHTAVPNGVQLVKGGLTTLVGGAGQSPMVGFPGMQPMTAFNLHGMLGQLAPGTQLVQAAGSAGTAPSGTTFVQGHHQGAPVSVLVTSRGTHAVRDLLMAT